MKRFNIKLKGSFTVEASLIFSIVFLLIALMVYTFIFMYKYTVLQSAVNEAAMSGAYDYVNKSNSNLYWRIYDTDSANKISQINNNVNIKLDQSVFSCARNLDTETSYKALIKQLNIRVEEQYPLPIGNLFMMFGVTPSFSLKVESVAPLDDYPEFIRNMDTVIDIKNCIINSNNKWVGKDSKVSDVIEKIIKKK